MANDGVPQYTRPLRLTLLAPGEIFGGAERQMLALCSQLQAMEIPVGVILFHDATLAAMLRHTGLVPTILRSGSSAFSPAAVQHLRDTLISTNTQVLHFHGYKAAVHAWLATKGLPIGIVKTEHGAIETRSSALRERARTALYRHLDALATRRLNPRIVYVTRELEQHFLEAHRRLERSVIYNGIDRAPDRSALTRPAEYSNRATNLLILGRLEQVKGIEHALRALTDAAVPTQALLHIVGDGPMRSDLEKLAQQSGLSQRVIFHGFKSNPYDYLAHADALLMPSVHEGLPYVLLEAMSLRVPVIVSNVGGLKEVLKDGTTGLLVPVGDSPGIARAIGRLTAEPALRDKLTDAAEHLAATAFSGRTMTEGYLRIYRDALESRAGRRS
jgi:glycosyltransferase involved in cell wall biosynthesis